MRLRLRIERNGLPPTQAIWPVKEGKTTIAQLVQSVNEVFPLEVDSWGLEDYSVSVGGYECLHYHELGTVCRDEDEVVIRPLEYVDVRARALMGRDQIAANGQHLVDGVPFGRPCLKGPVRPQMRIPPRKRRKLTADEETEEEQLMIMQAGQASVDDDEDKFEDEDFEVNDANESVSNDETSDSEEDDTEDSSESGNDSNSSSDDSDTTSESDSDDESWDGIQTTPNSKTPSNLPNGTAPVDPSVSPTSTKRKRDADTQHSEPKQPTKDHELGRHIPYKGTAITKQRNQRRRDAKKLKHLKTDQVLPPDADFSAMREWDNGDHKRKVTFENGVEELQEASAVQAGAKRLRKDSNDTSVTRSTSTESSHLKSSFEPGNSAPKTKPTTRATSETERSNKLDQNFEEQRQKLLSRIAGGGVEVVGKSALKGLQEPVQSSNAIDDEDEPPDEVSSKQLLDATDGTDAVNNNMLATGQLPQDTPTEVIAPARRAQLDIVGSRRLLFGSLGVRAPKTEEERELVRKKLADRPKRNANASNQDSAAITVIKTTNGAESLPGASDVEEDPGLWQERIHLTAVECCDDGITLSTPPFPFYQRWDPQYNKKKKRNSSKYSAKAKRNGTKPGLEYVETYDKYNINANGDALEYDDVSGEEYWEDGALLGDDDGAEPDEDEDDGFPAVPPDLDQLPQLLLGEAQEGDFVAFTELACDEGTAWQPKTVMRTAKIIKMPSSEAADGEDAVIWCILQLAQRDVKVHIFDDDGNRVYSKFDMPDPGEEEDDGKRQVAWQDLGAVKLILRPEAATVD